MPNPCPSEINTGKILVGTKDNSQLIAPTVDDRLGGRTRYFSTAWQEFGLEEVIAKGIKVEWGEDGPPTEGVISDTTNGEVCTWNPTFVVAKSDGGRRRILDCRTLNQNVVPRHFKMESFSTVAQSITQGCWMCSLDLKHVYIHVAIHKRDQPHFGFLHNGRAYIQQTLCFGLTSAPWQFPKLLRPEIAQFRRFISD